MTKALPIVRALTFLSGMALSTGAAQAELADEAAITEGLINVAIAYEIGARCDSLDARRLAGINYLFSLKAEAGRRGYSDEEITAYIEDRAEKDRLEAIARQRLADLGAVDGQWETYCTVGQAQIAENTVAGQLLR